jgi:hypothetical protein
MQPKIKRASAPAYRENSPTYSVNVAIIRGLSCNSDPSFNCLKVIYENVVIVGVGQLGAGVNHSKFRVFFY